MPPLLLSQCHISKMFFLLCSMLLSSASPYHLPDIGLDIIPQVLDIFSD